MVHRIAIVGGVAAAAGILLIALGVGSLFARPTLAGDATSQPTAGPTARTQVDTVYVKPAPPQRVVHVTQTTRATGPRPTQRVVVVTKSHGDDDSDSEDSSHDSKDDGGKSDSGESDGGDD